VPQANVPPTVAALREIGPGLIAPMHCSGFAAQKAISEAMPDAYVQNVVGTRSRSARERRPLAGLRVLDAGVLFAAPLCATLLGDFGADVIKIEHPSGDPLRSFGWQEDGESLWWKVVARNKRSVALDLSQEDGQEAFARLVEEADVVLESFRPGTLERWNLGYERLAEGNPGLILLRTSGFGQTGPYRDRPGFGTLAESMSGFAAITGDPDGPPTLPSIALADGIAAVTGAMMVSMALTERAVSGLGQIIDLSLVEPMLWVLGPQATVYDRLGIVQGRSGNRTPFSAPRNLYRTADDQWIAMSGSSQNTAVRVLRLIGGDELAAIRASRRTSPASRTPRRSTT